MRWLYESADEADGDYDGFVKEKDMVRIIHIAECKDRCYHNGGDCCADEDDGGAVDDDAVDDGAVDDDAVDDDAVDDDAVDDGAVDDDAVDDDDIVEIRPRSL